jgi:hypothetical protein
MSSYFADPDHTQIPSLTDMTTLEELVLNNPSSITISTAGNGAVISVGDDAGRCPYTTADTPEVYWVYFGTDTGNDPGWG